MEGLYYKHSGQFSISGLLFGLVVGTLIACLAGFIYAYLILYIPFIYINFFITAGFGGIAGGAAAMLLKKRHVRSTPVALAVTLAVTTLAYYFSWTVWMWAAMRRGDADLGFAQLVGLALQPGFAWELVTKINEVGAWSIRSYIPTGAALWGAWAIEAAIVYGVSLMVAFNAMEEEPYCESCAVWCEKKAGVLKAATQNVDEFRQRMEAKDFRYLEGLGAPSADCADWQQVDIFSCPKCANLNTLEAKRITVTVEKDKKKEQSADLMSHLLLSVSEAEALRKLGERMNAAPAEQAAAASASS